MTSHCHQKVFVQADENYVSSSVLVAYHLDKIRAFTVGLRAISTEGKENMESNKFWNGACKSISFSVFKETGNLQKGGQYIYIHFWCISFEQETRDQCIRDLTFRNNTDGQLLVRHS